MERFELQIDAVDKNKLHKLARNAGHTSLGSYIRVILKDHIKKNIDDKDP